MGEYWREWLLKDEELQRQANETWERIPRAEKEKRL